LDEYSVDRWTEGRRNDDCLVWVQATHVEDIISTFSAVPHDGESASSSYSAVVAAATGHVNSR